VASGARRSTDAPGALRADDAPGALRADDAPGAHISGESRSASVMACSCHGTKVPRGTKSPQRAVDGPSAPEMRESVRLYRTFNQFRPSHMSRIRHPRLMPAVVVQLGELIGLIYRSDKWQAGSPRTFIHIMEDVANGKRW